MKAKNFFQPIYNAIISVLKWFAGILEDVKGVASSKRVELFIVTYLLGVIVFAAKENKWANDSIHMQIFWGITLIIGFLLGALSKEAINKIIGFKLGKKDETTD